LVYIAVAILALQLVFMDRFGTTDGYRTVALCGHIFLP